MKSLILAIVFGFTANLSAIASEPTIVTSITNKWEYKQIPWTPTTETAAMQSQLDTLGDQGWELSGTIARRTTEGSDILLFKRGKDSEDATIEFVENLDLIVVRGSKTAVERTVTKIQAAKDSAKKKTSP